MVSSALVTVGLPVRNGAATLEEVARSVLAQDHENLELLISDNASTDDTENVGRRLAQVDPRVRYHRQPRNIGLIANFEWTKRNARGDYFRWIGDNDGLHPSHVSRCVAEFEADPRLVLVTTQLEYLTDAHTVETVDYPSRALRSDNDLVRLKEWLRLLNDSYQCLDPLYGLARTDAVRDLPHDRMLRGDEVYAVKLVLAGPWGHLPEVLGSRPWSGPKPKQLTTLLELPGWHARTRDLRQTRAILRLIDAAGFDRTDRQAARAAAIHLYFARHAATARRRSRRLAAAARKGRFAPP